MKNRLSTSFGRLIESHANCQATCVSKADNRLRHKVFTALLGAVLSILPMVSSGAQNQTANQTDSLIESQVASPTEVTEPRDLAPERVLVFDIKEEINSTAWIHTSKALAKAKEVKAKHIVLHMNTYGGEVLYADSIRTAIISNKIPIYAYIDVNAASAGALIATACDSIFMSPGSSIGAASVVNGGTGEKMPDKYQSYMRAIMRSTAESHPYNGPDTTRKYLRDPRLAEAFVDECVVIEGIIDSAHVLTFTAQEAVAHKYCEGIYTSLDDVVDHVAPHGAIVERYEPSGWDDVKGGLLSTTLRGILILVIIGGIYFELQTPGIGFALLAAGVAAVLYFAPLYIDGLAANWEIILFLVGLGLVALEIFVIPGFGVSGIAGAACMIASLWLSLVGNDGFSFDGVSSASLSVALWMVAISLVIGVGLCVFLTMKIFKAQKGSLWARLTLSTSQENADGYVGVEKDLLDSMIGKEGVAETDLRPGGKVAIDDTTYDAMSDGQYIERGNRVRVTATSSGQLVVKRA